MYLNHLNGRVEDAVIGRFLSPDPNIPDPGNTQSWNRYSYVNNNPLSYVDPSGFCGTHTLDSFSITITTPGHGATFDVGPDGNFTEGTILGSTSATTSIFLSTCNDYEDPMSKFWAPSPPVKSPMHPKLGQSPAQSQNPITKFRNFICSAPAVSVGLKLQLNYGFLSLFGAEGQVSLSVTSHGQLVWTQTGGGVVGVNQGLILSGGAQGGYSSQDAPSGFSTVSTLGGEVIATAGEGFGASASASTDGSGLSVDALGSGSFATGVGLVSGANYQTGLAIATPSLCP
jgi:hypothetical protein